MKTILAAVLLLGGAQVATEYAPHAPIFVDSNDDLTVAGQPNLLMGVRSGQGTAEDPFVISDWAIGSPGYTYFDGCCGYYQFGIPGIRLEHTSDHILVLRNRIAGTPPPEALASPFTAYGRPPIGMTIHGATNITIDMMFLRNFAEGIVIVNSRNIEILHLNATQVDWAGITIINSEVTISESVFQGPVFGVQAIGSRISIRQSSFSGHETAVLSGPTSVSDLRWNWWGVPGGPNTPGGERVECIDCTVNPWLTAPPEHAGYESSPFLML